MLAGLTVMKQIKGKSKHRGRDHPLLFPVPQKGRYLYLKGVAFFTFFSFLFSSVVWSAPPVALETAQAQHQKSYSVPNISEIHIPEEFGIVEEVYKTEASEKSPLIIYIQDAHTVYEAQSNIRKIIDKIQKDNDVKLVALEGGDSKIDPLLFRTFPLQDVKEKVLDGYVRRGELSGAEFAAIANEKESDFWGVEDMDLYHQNKEAFLKAIDKKPRIDMKLDDIGRWLEKKKDEIYSPELKELYQKQTDYENERLSLIDYSLYLTEADLAAGLKQAAVREDYPTIIALHEAVKREKSMDMSRVDEEGKLLTRDVERLLKNRKDNSLADFQERLKKFNLGEIKKDSFYIWLLGQAKQH